MELGKYKQAMRPKKYLTREFVVYQETPEAMDDVITEDKYITEPMPSQAPPMDNVMPTVPGMEDPRLRQIELADGGVVEREGFVNAGLVQVKSPSVKELKNPSNPKKPFVYRSPDGPQYFATKEEALNAMQQRKIQQYKAREKPLEQSEINKVKKLLEKGKSYPEIVKETGMVLGRVQKAAKKIGFKYESYVDNIQNRKFVKDNYGTLSRSTIGKRLFPNAEKSVQYDRAGKIIGDLISNKEIKKVPAGFVKENREKFNYNPDIQDAKVKAKRRKLIRQVSDYNKELQLANLKKGFNVDLAHRLSLKQIKKVNELYNLSNLGIDTSKINRELVKPYENKLKDLYTQQNKLVRKAKKLGEVTNDITKGLSNINEQISDIVLKTKGRIQGIHIDEYNLKPKIPHIDYTKVLGMGVIDPKVKNITKQDLALVSEMLPSQIASEQALEKKINKIVTNIGCPTGALKASTGANCYVKGMEKIQSGNLNKNEFNILQKAVKSPAAVNAIKYGGVALKGLGAILTPLMFYDTYSAYKEGKPISEALEYGLLGTNIIGSIRDESKFTPQEREAKGATQQYEREQDDISGLSSDFYVPSNLSAYEAAKITEDARKRIAAERAAEEKQRAAEIDYQGDPGIQDDSGLYATGGRVGLKDAGDPKDKPILPINPMIGGEDPRGPLQDPGRRDVLKGIGFIGGMAALGKAGLLKLGKAVKKAKLVNVVKPMGATITKFPKWFPSLINRFRKEGKQIPIFKEIEVPLTEAEYNKLSNEGAKRLQDHYLGRTENYIQALKQEGKPRYTQIRNTDEIVGYEYQVKDLPGTLVREMDGEEITVYFPNAYGRNVEMKYIAPKVTVDMKGKKVKYDAEFEVNDAVPEMAGPEDVPDFFPGTVDNLDDVYGGASKIEQYATKAKQPRTTLGDEVVNRWDAGQPSMTVQELKEVRKQKRREQAETKAAQLGKPSAFDDTEFLKNFYKAGDDFD